MHGLIHSDTLIHSFIKQENRIHFITFMLCYAVSNDEVSWRTTRFKVLYSRHSQYNLTLNLLMRL